MTEDNMNVDVCESCIYPMNSEQLQPVRKAAFNLWLGALLKVTSMGTMSLTGTF
jgi:hypothetical protein